jgi:hypothetical protein
MTSWLAKYPEFHPDPVAPLLDEFSRLAIQRNWKAGSKRYRKEWKDCVEENFTAEFGQNASSLAGWQALCTEVGITDVPTSITGCKKVSISSHNHCMPLSGHTHSHGLYIWYERS